MASVRALNEEGATEDIAVTKKVAEAGNLLGVELLDHIVIGDRYVSLKENGYL